MARTHEKVRYSPKGKPADLTPTSAADAHGLSVDEYLRILLGLNRRRTADTSLAEFESDLNAFSDGTEDLVPTNHTYSREDIYFDHD